MLNIYIAISYDVVISEGWEVVCVCVSVRQREILVFISVEKLSNYNIL